MVVILIKQFYGQIVLNL